jgi:hydrogenase maturation protein HypF
MIARVPADVPTIRRRIRITGVVQGVGFRPYVAALARRLGLSGLVGNDGDGVFIEVEGTDHQVSSLLDAVAAETPSLARIDTVVSDEIPPTGDLGFSIATSRQNTGHDALVTADAATCADCLAEIRDPAQRRHRYPFTNCTNCGPRFTIVRGVPYDRETTSMADFAMCADCRSEYEDESDRRYHAEPICCPACGPTLQLVDGTGAVTSGDPIAAAAGLLRAGRIVAIKGLGGYHLAVDARNDAAVAALRTGKHREERPFALMVANLEAAHDLCVLGPGADQLLSSPAHPIVLLPARGANRLAVEVAPHTTDLGVMLPYTPLHHLLLDTFGGPLVLTSGNRSDEPIAFDDVDAVERLREVADAFLVHDRRIQTRVDDSVVRPLDGTAMVLRRSRGYAPRPITLSENAPRPVLGCGAELKSTFCLARDRHAFLSHHIGDLENYETLTSYVEGIEHLSTLFDLEPVVVAHDLHPDYLSTRYAVDRAADAHLAVQHHHAHIASCLADNGHAGPVIGVAFDGTGLGPDNELWGGEFLIADLADATRVARLRPVPLRGGAAAIRAPWRMASAYLDAAYDGAPPELAVALRNEAGWEPVRRAADAGLNSPPTSSVGRLFDAVASILGVRDEVSYEGQAAIELEQLADVEEAGSYATSTDDGDLLELQATDLVRAVVRDHLADVPVPVIAARFHNAVARLVVETCDVIREEHALSTVALSGGVFQNLRLLRHCLRDLGAAGFEVLIHHQVPPNDGGISLGQVAVAIARDRQGRL